VRHAEYRHVPFLHRFQERSLRTRSRTVQLVGEHHVAKDRTRLKRELAEPSRTLRQQVRAGHIRRHQIRRALNPGALQVERIAERAYEERFSETRRPFEQHVTPAEERDQQVIDEGRLPNEHAADFGAKLRKNVTEHFGLGFDLGG
jgi:hypothetical protein